MEQKDKQEAQLNIYRLSWVAYIKPAVIVFVMLGVSIAMFDKNGGLSALIGTITLLGAVYKFLYFKSIELYTDENGVWMYKGILPWTKGVYGIKWQDLEDATFYQGFFSWIFKSYKVRIGHRFTRSSEIVINHISKGHDAASTINSLHRKMIEDSAQPT